MKQGNTSQPEKINLSTPNTFAYGRSRLYSLNTPQLSPLKMIQSPFINIGEGCLFENQLSLAGEFRLQEGIAVQENDQIMQQSSDEQVEEMDFPRFPKDAKVTKDNMVEFLVDSISLDEERIATEKDILDYSSSPFISEVFLYLYKRFKKAKKTKEEMIKYTMRKSFKYITDQLKKQDPSLIPLLATDGLEGMSIYFRKHCDDQQIFIPFKKNSLEKTMNTAFLKKVFSIYRFYRDYKKFLKTFQNEFLKDNKKKIATMNEAVKQCINTKNLKALQNFKRLPWTKDVLMKLKEFANELLAYSTFSRDGAARPQLQQAKSEEGSDHQYAGKMDLSFEHDVKLIHKRSIDSLKDEDPYRDLINNDQQQHQKDDDQNQKLNCQKKIKKRNVIVLTPPIHPINSPKMSDFGLSLE